MSTALACDAPASWLAMETAEHSQHKLWINPDDIAYSQGTPFGADILVCHAEKKQLVHRVSIDAAMPAHKHGMNYRPTVIPAELANRFRADGLFFHMSGQWQITVTLELASARERHSIEIKVQ